jgi:uncharacterized protein (DUF1800 family)
METVRRMRPARFANVMLAAAAATAAAGVADAADISPHDLALLNRVTWGATAADAAELQRLGASAWLDRQLHPSTHDRLPPAAQAQIDAMSISRTPVSALFVQATDETRALKDIADPNQKKLAQQARQQAFNDVARQAAARQILRNLYSPDQLQEQMTWFWFNHFNVFQQKAAIRVTVGDYEDRAIRAHALGRFRDLLEATLRHPAMLQYLDNAANASGKINENYAREIMELHTMGVGSGYTQKDVQELARILTGVGIDPRPDQPHPNLPPQAIRQGLFAFYPARHDFGDKVFLGHVIRGRGFGEVEEALDILAREPATARHVSTQLAAYFVSDNPPAALVDRMAATFQHTDGDIAAVLSTLFHSPEFAASLGGEFKDPAHYVFSAVRLAYGDRVITNTQPVLTWLNRLAEGLYNHETPDGYPTGAAAWNGPGQMATRFEIARAIGSNAAGLFRIDGAAPVERPAFPQLQNALYYDVVSQTLAGPTRTALDQATSPQDWNTLFLSSPEFMRR